MMDKQERYELVCRQAEALLSVEYDEVARMANIAALLREEFGWWWVGFYRVVEDELVLGPFQGPVACTRIRYGRGVCGTAWQNRETIVVPDVELFPGHIACSSVSRSEIVVPIFRKGEVVAVLDIDSEHLNHFDDLDATNLQRIAILFYPHQ